MNHVGFKTAMRGFVFSLCCIAHASNADAGAGEIDQQHHEHPIAQAYIISPGANEVVTSPFTVKFGLKGMKVSPAGVAHPNGGHHHLIIDSALPDMKMPIPLDKHHHHFGKGQTETVLELPPGQHTLQLLVGDHLHRPHATPVVSEQITITVK